MIDLPRRTFSPESSATGEREVQGKNQAVARTNCPAAGLQDKHRSADTPSRKKMGRAQTKG
jgi:hypothetical protein